MRIFGTAEAPCFKSFVTEQLEKHKQLSDHDICNIYARKYCKRLSPMCLHKKLHSLERVLKMYAKKGIIKETKRIKTPLTNCWGINTHEIFYNKA